MGSYIINFTVYTMAMCGLIFFALFVYKKTAGGNFGGKNSHFLNIEDCLSLGPRKNLFVIRAGHEKFLIASDTDKTTLISKLENNSSCINENIQQSINTSIQHNYIKNQQPKNYEIHQSFDEIYNAKQTENKEKTVFNGIDDLPEIQISSSKKRNQSADVLKNMISRIKD